ncbi:hypothetical protein YUYDRAFT_02060 [Streptomyces sp. ScaeMP-e48]|nr:hypothetical protein YUYDRAFT_02060 [Streptomyces sp. ScaeMP-e48]
MTLMDTRPAIRPEAAYRSPECRVAADWPEAHRMCAGNQDITVGAAIIERLHCACPCHT